MSHKNANVKGLVNYMKQYETWYMLFCYTWYNSMVLMINLTLFPVHYSFKKESFLKPLSKKIVFHWLLIKSHSNISVFNKSEIQMKDATKEMVWLSDGRED